MRSIHRKTTGTHALIGWEVRSHEGMYKPWHKIVTLHVHALIMQARNEKPFWADEYPARVTFLLTDETWKIFANVLYFSWLLNSQEEQGWHSGEDTRLSPMLPRFKSQPGYLICGLSLLFVLSLVLIGFSPGTPVFPSQRAKKLKKLN